MKPTDEASDGRAGAAGEPTVLVVEDEPNLADAYAAWLREDYHVLVAHGGADALETLAERTVDVVLLDRHMPAVSGDEVLVTLRDWGLDARVAMVTGVTPDVDVLDLGFDDYLQKPVDAEELRAAVARLVAPRSYESLHIELSSLRVKRNVLQVEHARETLRGDPRYVALCERIERLEERMAERRSAVAASPATGD